jgi:nucleoside 2-deoxyribosyltransferase
MKDYKIYLSGPMTGLRSEEANSWREYIRISMPPNIQCLSPLRGQVDIGANEVIKSDYCNSLFCNQRAITSRDRNDVIQCDLAIVNFLGAKRVSIGSVIEMGWLDILRKPIVLVMEESGNYHDHPIVKDMSHFIVKDLDEAVLVVRSILDT